jgi:CelD/BcsL family acetyltransferase involved in cellulose biosynthesis
MPQIATPPHALIETTSVVSPSYPSSSNDVTVTGLKVQAIRSLAELETIRGHWDDLLASYPLATTFSTPEWLIPWWRNFATDEQLLVVCFLDVDSRLVALAPCPVLEFKWQRSFR